jgi:DNA-binding transcriptional MerR regulator
VSGRRHTPAGASEAPGRSTSFSIGEAAELTGTTTRTLRYYEELGLVSSQRSSGSGQRRYSQGEIERIRHIRELQNLLGLDLDEIAGHLQATDRLDGLREEYRAGPPEERREAILEDAATILEALRRRAVERQERLTGFVAELDERLEKISRARSGASVTS